jgi:hypothetical protein
VWIEFVYNNNKVLIVTFYNAQREARSRSWDWRMLQFRAAAVLDGIARDAVLVAVQFAGLR